LVGYADPIHEVIKKSSVHDESLANDASPGNTPQFPPTARFPSQAIVPTPSLYVVYALFGTIGLEIVGPRGRQFGSANT
jgi:hypothetical protein